ncbi:ABC transporter ATP-binding protein [Exiguobacterium sp. B2(2022)]|uniref:ABC transporter ATP-binding protein n=1 Tax=Exiguobacterium sp. B2(2022) TaxID=2992755 RepID=UPI00237AF549|nr:ABC transporter ATP-binding protein [Exiguobacterium sp. B2(2022)]MDE0562861.1 ABC transporter ATP-binding protein/permease [Exiguobacterium sp. B2(2022)]
MNSSTWKTFFQLFKIANPPKGLFVGAILISLLQAVASLAIPLILQRVVDRWSSDLLTPEWIAYFIIAFLVQVITSALSIYWLHIVGQRVVANLRTTLWDHLIKLPIPFYDGIKSGELVSRLNNDTTTLQQLLSEQSVRLLTSFVSVIGAVAILFTLDWQMTLVILFSVPTTLVIVIPLGRKLRVIAKETQQELGNLSGFFAELLGEIRLVKSQATEQMEVRTGKVKIETLFDYGVKEGRIQAILIPLLNVTLTGMLIAILGFGAYRVSTGALSTGELLAFMLYVFQIITPLITMSEFLTRLQKARGATERIAELLDVRPEPYSTYQESIEQADLSFENVTFHYGTEPVLQGLSLHVSPGATTAIVGRSGAGKTTLFSLVEQFYTPTEGLIRYGNRDIQTYGRDTWRQIVGYVAQDSPVLSGSVRTNIIYGLQREVSDEEIKEACEMANAWSFIEVMPNQLETEIGERGIRLSGGQRQRLAIARALLRNPQILLLDEATSSLDSESERVVQEALDRLMVGRTTLVIAHRLSTVRHANQIVVLEDGRISGIGKHEQLLNENALYQRLVSQQLLGGQST